MWTKEKQGRIHTYSLMLSLMFVFFPALNYDGKVGLECKYLPGRTSYALTSTCLGRNLPPTSKLNSMRLDECKLVNHQLIQSHRKLDRQYLGISPLRVRYLDHISSDMESKTYPLGRHTFHLACSHDDTEMDNLYTSSKAPPKHSTEHKKKQSKTAGDRNDTTGRKTPGQAGWCVTGTPGSGNDWIERVVLG